ncbi:MAG: hypothetical protein ACYSU0_21280 [Planctomycetota bacterium]|jgi:hypothetical protein
MAKRRWPKAPHRLSSELDRISRPLRATGIVIEKELSPDPKRRRLIRLKLADEAVPVKKVKRPASSLQARMRALVREHAKESRVKRKATSKKVGAKKTPKNRKPKGKQP